MAMIGSGAVGASLVSLFTEFAMFGGAMILTPKHLLDARSAGQAARVVIAGIATVAVGAALLPFSLALAIIGGAAAYFGVALALRALTLEDVRLLSARLPLPLRRAAT